MGTGTPISQVSPGRDDIDRAEVELVARGIATAVAPHDGLTDVQAALLEAIASALTGHDVNYSSLEPLSPDGLAEGLSHRDDEYRQRIVHHMVLGELVLRPLPQEVAVRVAKYAKALGIDDHFVRVARRYAQGAYGLAWMDLRRSGFSDGSEGDPFEAPGADPDLLAKWSAFEELPPGSLGRSVWEMYTGRGFTLPGSATGASPMLAQHDFVHVLADYGTNLKGEVEVFALIGRADPDPRGFAWLATLVGLFETGYIADTNFFQKDTREPVIQVPGMNIRVADAIRRGKAVCLLRSKNLFDVDFHELASEPVEAVREHLGIPPKSELALDKGSAGLFDLDGMSVMQRAFATRQGGTA